MNENVCCFTGHREVGGDLDIIGLRVKIDELIERHGVDTFISGGAVGFDTIAGFLVDELKKKHPHIKLVIYVPCRNQDAKFSPTQKKDYKKLLSVADEIVTSDVPPTKYAFLSRDRRMVDDSSYCIAYLNKASGGTAYTVKYAKSKGRRVFNVSMTGI